MKKKILLITLIILILPFISIIYLKISSTKNTEETPITIVEPKLELSKTLELCKDKNKCPIISENIYADLVLNINSKEVQQWINKINQETENYYQETISSNILDGTCPNTQNIFNYKVATKTHHINYSNDKYISISVQRIKYNLCNNTKEQLPTEILLYSREKNKKITQEELKEELNLTNDTIKEAIKANANDLNTPITENFNYENYKLYYDITGCLLAEYQLDNDYYSAIVIRP